jgi:hypothetical protein
MRNHGISLVLAGILGVGAAAAGVAVAQHRVGPIYPPGPASNPPAGPSQGPAQAQSGYDPFQLDPSTGRFRYVPIPYEPQRPGQPYDPWRFNWYSGRWDYVPYPADWWNQPALPGLRGEKQVDGASTYVDTRIDTQAIPSAARIGPSQPARPSPGARPAPRAVPVPPQTQPAPRTSRVPSTGPSTRPSLVQPSEHAPAGAAGAARAAPPPSASPAERDGSGWMTLNGVTGRWEYDYSRGKWIFVLPSD